MSQPEMALRERGLKVTGHRRLILSLLEEAKDHPTAQEIHHRITATQRISLGTVYRILNNFVQVGIVVRHAFGGIEARYEVVSEQQHHHLLDAKTGRIVEIEDGNLTAMLEQIVDRRGYRLIGVRLELTGERKRSGHTSKR